jgi:glycogen phosphorylase
VPIVSGRVDAHDEIQSPQITPMVMSENQGNGCYRFQGSSHKAKSFFGYALRILPHHPDAVTPFIPKLITWASDSSLAAALEPVLR